MLGESLYRITCFGEPKGPWRRTRSMARRDAIALGLGEFDEYGQFYTNVPGAIEVQRNGLRLSA